MTCQVDVYGHEVALVHLQRVVLHSSQPVRCCGRSRADESIIVGQRPVQLLLHQRAHLQAPCACLCSCRFKLTCTCMTLCSETASTASENLPAPSVL